MWGFSKKLLQNGQRHRTLEQRRNLVEMRSLHCSKGSRCGRADSVLDSHTTGPGFKTRLVRYFLLSFRLLTTMTASR